MSAPHPFPVDPWACLRRAVEEFDAGRNDAALEECWAAWHAFQPGARGRVVATYIMGLALAQGDARRVLRQILPTVSLYIADVMLGPLRCPEADRIDTRPHAQTFDFPPVPS